MSEITSFADAVLLEKKLFLQKGFENERELSDIVASLSDIVYGKDSIYFHWEKRVRPSERKYNVTDGLLLDLSSEPYRFWIVEYELAIHSISSHVQPQVISFMRALRNQETLRDIQLDLYNEIRSDPMKRKKLDEKVGDEDLFFILDQLLHREPGVLVVIDERTAELEDVLEYLSLRAEEVRVLEFKRYTHGDEEAYRFNTLSLEDTDIEITKGPLKGVKERPPHHRTWEDRLKWASPNVRDFVESIIEKIVTTVPSLVHGPRQRQRHYFFYIQEPQVHGNMFAVILIQKQMLRVRFRLPDNFEDAENVTKLYKGWFYNRGQERAVEIRSKKDLDLLNNLILLAYNFTKKIV